MVIDVMPMIGSQRAKSRYDGISPATISAMANDRADMTSSARRG